MSARAAELQLVQGKLRVIRAGAFSACAVSLSTVAHVLAGGAAPAPLLLIALALLLAPAAAMAAGKLRGPVSVGSAMIAVQAGLHSVFGLFSSASMVAASCVQMSSHAGHSEMSGGMLCQDGSAMAMGSGTPLMTLAHLGAAAVLGLLLSRGETALWRMLLWIFPKLPGRFRAYPTTPRPRRATAHRTRPLRPAPLVGAVGRRGPPRLVAIFA